MLALERTLGMKTPKELNFKSDVETVAGSNIRIY